MGDLYSIQGTTPKQVAQARQRRKATLQTGRYEFKFYFEIFI